MKRLNNLRIEIDELDNKIRELLLKRMEVSVQVGMIKKELNLDVLNLKREEEIIENIKKELQDSPYLVQYLEIMNVILKTSKDLQKWKNLV